MNDQSSDFDTGIAWRLAGTILLFLAVVFLLQRFGFRFVVAYGNA